MRGEPNTQYWINEKFATEVEKEVTSRQWGYLEKPREKTIYLLFCCKFLECIVSDEITTLKKLATKIEHYGYIWNYSFKLRLLLIIFSQKNKNFTSLGLYIWHRYIGKRHGWGPDSLAELQKNFL